MVKKGKIAQYRERLDRTLASHQLMDEKILQSLVKDQLLRSSEPERKAYIDNILAKRTAEVSNFLEMLRSASENYEASPDKTPPASWKLKQDNEEFRVMYREGLMGSPFHTLLVEGYIEAPLDVCLCVSWETALYPMWFPETWIPTFKLIVSKCLQKVRIGEQISLVRMKLSWPLSNREAVLHYFEFEYLEDDLIVVLLNTISDVKNIQLETHGFSSDGIPEAEHTVRIDIVGGFALQKVTEDRSYFRTIGNLDVKLDFVPPSLINFISRQLIGSAFRLYQKIVSSIRKGDENFGKALSDPLYSRIREAIDMKNKSSMNLEAQLVHADETVQDELKKESPNFVGGDHANNSLDHKLASTEIEEQMEANKNIEEHEEVDCQNSKKGQNDLSNGDINEFSPDYVNKVSSEIEEEEIKESDYTIEDRPWRDHEITEEIKESNYTVEDRPLRDHEITEEEDKSTDQDYAQQLAKSSSLYDKKVISPQVEKALETLEKIISVIREGRLGSRSPALTSCIDGEKGASSKPLEEVTDPTVQERSRISFNANNSRLSDPVLPATEASPNKMMSPDQKFSSASASPETTSKLIRSASRKAPVIDGETDGNIQATVEGNGAQEREQKRPGQQKKWRVCCLQLISGKVVS